MSATKVASEAVDRWMEVVIAFLIHCECQVMLPDVMPAHFQSTYTPIAAAGTQLQIKHMARLLATQLVAAGLGKGDQQQQQQQKKQVSYCFCIHHMSWQGIKSSLNSPEVGKFLHK